MVLVILPTMHNLAHLQHNIKLNRTKQSILQTNVSKFQSVLSTFSKQINNLQKPTDVGKSQLTMKS